MKNSNFCKNRMYTKFALLVRLWHPVSPWRWPKSEKIGLAKYRKYKAASPLPFTFCSILAIFWEKRGAVTRSRVKIKIWPTYCDLAIPRHLSVKKFFGSSTFQFCGCRLQRTFKKNFIQIFSFGCFSRSQTNLFGKNQFDLLM